MARTNGLGHYRLVGNVPIPCEVLDWARWFEKSNEERVVGKTVITDDVWVSTVFLGIDHSFGGEEPLLFESMIFGGTNDGYCERCSSWLEAEEMHRVAVLLAKSEFS